MTGPLSAKGTAVTQLLTS